MTAKKEDLVASIQAQLGEHSTTKKEVELFLNAVLNGLLETAKAHGSVRSVLGTFKWVNKPARKAYNPKSNTFIDVGPYETLQFKTAPSVRKLPEVPKVKAKTEATPTAKKPAAAKTAKKGK